MNYIVEALFVGIYSTSIYLICSPFLINNIYIDLLVVGFLKHYLSYYIGLHSLYCKYGEACNKYNNMFTTKNSNKYLLKESIGEALLYLLLGSTLYYFIGNNFIYIFFLTGFILHILFEKLEIHSIFCRERCSIN